MNKNILYGLLGVGAIAGLYFWNKKTKSKMPISNDVNKKNQDGSSLTNEEIDKLSKEFADEINLEAKKELEKISLLKPQTKIQQVNGSDRQSQLQNSLMIFRNNLNVSDYNRKKAFLEKIILNNQIIYENLKKSIPKSKNLNDLITAKNMWIKYFILEKEGNPSEQEKIFLEKLISMGGSFSLFGLNLDFLTPKNNFPEKMVIQ
jgi:hypothetical protein